MLTSPSIYCTLDITISGQLCPDLLQLESYTGAVCHHDPPKSYSESLVRLLLMSYFAFSISSFHQSFLDETCSLTHIQFADVPRTVRRYEQVCPSLIVVLVLPQTDRSVVAGAVEQSGAAGQNCARQALSRPHIDGGLLSWDWATAPCPCAAAGHPQPATAAMFRGAPASPD